MITAIIKRFRSVKKKEWAIYHNVGVQHDAEKFSLIDNVLDGELNNFMNVKGKGNSLANSNLIVRLLDALKIK